MQSRAVIDGTTNMAAVIGSPIQHSKSPFIYNQSFERDDLNIVYLAFDTIEKDTVPRIESLKNLSVKGINITMPGKFEALKCIDHLDLTAEYVQAVNMIVPKNDEWVGYNTDGKGFWNAVKMNGVTIKNKVITIYGSGNTTRIILAQAVIEGVKEINVIARKIDRPLKIKKLIERLHKDYEEISIHLIDLAIEADVKKAVANADVLVQTTSVGMSESVNQSVLANEDWLNPETIVCDIVYEPRKTLFIQQAESAGCNTIGGIEMLVHQAAINYELMTGKKMDINYIINKLN